MYRCGLSFAFLVAGVLAATAPHAAAQKAARDITIITRPGASVWIDTVHFGKTDAEGRLLIKGVPAGRRTLRVRADGYSEYRKPIASSGEIRADLLPTTDEAVLAFQRAESLAGVDRKKSIEAYRDALRLRPRFPDALLGLVRVTADSGDVEGAFKMLADLKKQVPRSAEAAAVEGRLHKDVGDEAKAIAAFKRAIVSGGGYQPEAYTGLGLLYKDKAEAAGGAGDTVKEAEYYTESAKHLAAAVKQLSTAPDAHVVYQMLGLTYERQKRFNDAIAIYEEYLRLFPDSTESTAVRSFIVQLKKQMAEQE